jgi:hypothetical protein
MGATVEIRLDTPTGPLLGEPVLKAPISAGDGEDRPGLQSNADDRGAPARPVFLQPEPPVSISAAGASGRHNVYVVFTNADAGPEEALLLLTGIEFVPAGTPGSD